MSSPRPADVVEAFEAGDPGVWTVMAQVPTRVVLQAALDRIATGDFDAALARSAFLAIPADTAPLLTELFDRDHAGADYIALALAASRHPAAVDVLVELLGDDDLGRIALAGLSRQRRAAFPAVRRALRHRRRAVRLAALDVFDAWEPDADWRAAILEAEAAEQDGEVRTKLEPLVWDARGFVSRRAIDAIARSMTAEEAERIASEVEQLLYLGTFELLADEILANPDRAFVAAYQHLGLLSVKDDQHLAVWWRVLDLLGPTPVAVWLTAQLYNEYTGFESDWRGLLERYEELGAQAITEFVRAFNPAKLGWRRRQVFQEWLAGQMTDDDLDLIAERLRHPESNERDMTVELLQMVGPPAGIAALIHLDAPRAEARAAATRVLIACSSRPLLDPVANALETERARDPRALLIEAWFAAEDLLAPTDRGDLPAWAADRAERLPHAARKGSFDIELRWSDGSPVPSGVVDWLVARAKSQRERPTDPTLPVIAEQLDQTSRFSLHRRLLGPEPIGIEPWMAHTWIALGSPEQRIAARHWIEGEEGRRGDLLDARLAALESCGGIGAWLLDAWARAGNFGNTQARNRLADRAKDADMTRAAFLLDDVPRFGFDTAGRAPWTLGSRTGLQLEWHDARLGVVNESGDRLRSVPTPRSDDPRHLVELHLSQFRGRREGLRFMQRSLRDRLEANMLDGWSVPAQSIYGLRGHPVAHPLASRILWGAVRRGKPPLPLRFDEEGQFADLEDQVVHVDADIDVIPIHPADMPDVIRERWMKLFGDYEILQPFEQLDRRVFRPHDSELSMDRLSWGFGRKVSGYDLQRLRWTTAGSFGWSLHIEGSPWVTEIYRHFPRWNLNAVVRLDPGFNIQTGYDLDKQDLHVVYISRHNDLAPIDQQERIAMIDAPPAVFSEILYFLDRAAGS